MGAVAQRMWRPLSVESLLPLTDRDKRRYFEMATIARSIAIAVLGTVLLWSFRESSPVVLVGDEDAIVDELQRRRDRWGYSYTVLQFEQAEPFAPIVAHPTGR